MRRRHANVDESDVRTLVAHGGEECVGVAGLADDLDVVLGQQACDSLPNERCVVGDYDAHGNSA